ncbi:class I SAM-dependent methyltransferase [Candidatus Margulisiibacteriota bacterium]
MGQLEELFCKKLFFLWQKIGFHITKVDFDSPIPDTRSLKDALWEKHTELIGINMNEAYQLKLLDDFSSRFYNEYKNFPRNKTSDKYQYYTRNYSFEAVDGEMLYCMIRNFKPRRMIEIGSGLSTLLSAKALTINEAESSIKSIFTAIEPYPKKYLLDGFPGLSNLIIKNIEDVELSVFDELEENDILFIDGAHTLKIGGAVQYEYLEILPRLKKGVLIHIHDIMLPAEYDKGRVLKEHHFWNEQYLLQAFLAFNDAFMVMWAANYMRLKYHDRLEKAFPSYKKDKCGTGSLWIKKIK